MSIYYCVAFIDGKTFKHKDVLRAGGCHWNGKSRIWTKQCQTEADWHAFAAFLAACQLTARIVYPDGTQVTPPRAKTICPEAPRERHAVYVKFGQDAAFVKSFILADDAKRLARMIETRYPVAELSVDIVVGGYAHTTCKWPELKAHLANARRSNFDIGAPQH